MVFHLASGPNITFILGITNLIFLSLTFFSCRCLMGKPLTEFLWKREWYKRFYATHCWWWRFFFLSVALHSIIAITSFGVPRF